MVNNDVKNLPVHLSDFDLGFAFNCGFYFDRVPNGMFPFTFSFLVKLFVMDFKIIEGELRAEDRI